MVSPLFSWLVTHAALEYYWSQFHSLNLLNLRQFQNNMHRKEKGNISRFPITNEIVLLREPKVPRGEWKIGKIVNVYMKQATATVFVSRPQSSIVVWSIKLLHPLEIN